MKLYKVVIAVASLSSLPSPPFRLCRRLPLLLRRRRKGAAGYIPPEDASPRRHLPQHHNQRFHYNSLRTTSQPVYCRQPIYHRCTASYRAADNHTTIAQQGYRGRTAGVPRAHRRRTVDVPQTQTQTQTTITTTTTTTTTIRRRTADAPQMHCRRRQQPPQYTTP